MNSRIRNLIVAFAACAMVGGVVAWAQEGRRDRRGGSNDRPEAVARAENDPFVARYGALLDNNIFLRDRRPPRQPTTGPTTRQAAPPPPEKSWMLVGVVFEEGSFHAYFENLQTSSVTRATLGESIANGAVAELYIDAIAYVADGQVSWIEIGQDLTGAFPEGLATPQRPAAAASGGTRTPGAPGQPNPNTLSIEERLRQRRLQETGGAAAPVRVQFEGGEAVILKGAEGEGAMILRGSQVPPPGDAPPQRGSDTPPPDEPPPEDPGGRDPD